jgi:hypothetical protein
MKKPAGQLRKADALRERMKTGTRAALWALTLTLVALLAAPLAAAAAEEEKPLPQILVTNVNVWDGTSDGVVEADVLVEGNLIKEVAAGIRTPAGAEVIDGGGRTLIHGRHARWP